MFYNDKMKLHYNVVAVNTICTKRIHGLHYNVMVQCSVVNRLGNHMVFVLNQCIDSWFLPTSKYSFVCVLVID